MVSRAPENGRPYFWWTLTTIARVLTLLRSQSIALMQAVLSYWSEATQGKASAMEDKTIAKPLS